MYGRLPASLLVVVSGVVLISSGLVSGGSPTGHPTVTRSSALARSIVPSAAVDSTSTTGWLSLDLNGAYTSVNATWKVPIFKGACPHQAQQRTALFGVGFSPVSNALSSRSERVGTGMTCDAGVVSYFAWYRFAPQPLSRLSLLIHGGDQVTAWAGSVGPPGHDRIRLTLSDLTTRAHRSVSRVVPKILRGADWVVERPRGPNGTFAGLPDFGRFTFTRCYTDYLGSPNNIASAQNDTLVTMVSKPSGRIISDTALPSATDLTVQWY